MHNHETHWHRHHPEGGRPGFRGGHGFQGPRGDGPPNRRGFGGGPGGPGGRGGRMRRGEARFFLLDTLRDGPKHGYEIIKTLEEKSGGQYAPSPGTVYPTLQFLEDMGLIRADQEGERRVFSLTEAGQTELEKHTEAIAAFWERFKQPAPDAAQFHEIGFLKEEMEDLNRTVWNGLSAVIEGNDREQLRAMRRALERCKNEIRDIIASAPAPGGDDGEAV